MCQGSVTTLEVQSTGASITLTGPFACDYDLNHKLNAPLRGHRFRKRDDIAIAVRRMIMTNFSHGEADGIRRLPHRWQRTIDSFGDHFEGL